MSNQYRATPEQWADLGAFASGTRACVLELLDRIEALEALHGAVVELNQRFTLDPLVARIEALEAQQWPQDKLDRLIEADRNAAMDELRAASAEARPGGLVERVAKALYDAPHPVGDWSPEARAAIRAVAAWLRTGRLLHAAELLEQEADRG